MKLCEDCEREIPEARIRAQGPDVRFCTVCTEARGDVPLTRKFEAYDSGGELNHEIFYDHNVYIEGYVNTMCTKLGRLRTTSPYEYNDTPYT